MFDYNGSGSGDLVALTAAGVVVPSARGVGVTLTAATFFVPIGDTNSPTPSEASVIDVQLKWVAAVAGAITLESCNFPMMLDNVGVGPSLPTNATDVSDFDTTAGNWIPVASAVNQDVVGTGNTATGNAITAGGTNAGGACYRLVTAGSRRYRIKLVLSVGGIVRVNRRGKNAA